MPPLRLLIAAIAVVASGCAADAPPVADARVVLTEMAIGIGQFQPMGTSVWEVANTGAAHHNLTICPGDIDRCVEQPIVQRVLRKPEGARDPQSLPDETPALVLGDGWESLVEVDLEPGRYRLYCGVPNHAAKGMQTMIKVR